MTDWQPPPAWPAAAPERRPGTVTAAAVLTWVGSGLVGAALACMVVFLAVAPSLDEASSTTDLALVPQARQVLLAVGLVGLVWCAVSAVLAGLVFRRSTWARVALTASAGGSALACLAAIGSLISVVPLAMAVTAVVLLYVGGANDWFARRQQLPQRLYPPYGP